MMSMVKNLKILPLCLRRFPLYTNQCTQFSQALQTPGAPAAPLLAEPLSQRALVRVQGKEVVPFLQGLITNDMKELSESGKQSIYTMFLNNSGRAMYDSIIYKTPDPEIYIIECDREVSVELRRHLRMFRVKKKIDIDCINSDYTPWVVYNPQGGGEQPKPSGENLPSKPDELLYTTDPRVEELGMRIIQPSNCEISDIAKLFPNQSVDKSGEYNLHRLSHGVGEGVVDHPPGKCFPLEANCDFLHGISFHKGCYVGQELTARVYHTGVVRKRLMPLQLSADVDGEVSQVQTQAGAVVGTIRSVAQRRALALLRVEQVLNAGNLMVDGELCKAIKPHWWPQDIPSRTR